ncbi:MAG: hypothetical protein RL494_447 [Bacteroidota bacterium]|jgi:hypothetical protein
MACPSVKTSGQAPEAKAELAKQSVTSPRTSFVRLWTFHYTRAKRIGEAIPHAAVFQHSTFPTHPNKSVSSAFQKQTLYKISILNTLICLTWFKKKVLTKTLEATLSLYFNFSNPCHLRSKNDCYSK